MTRVICALAIVLGLSACNGGGANDPTWDALMQFGGHLDQTYGAPAYQAPTYTNCQRVGQQVQCVTY